MTLNLGSPWLSRLSHPSPHLSKLSDASSNNSSIPTPIFNANSESSPLKNRPFSAFSASTNLKTKASLSQSENEVAEEDLVSDLLDEDLLNRVSVAKDANEALDWIAERSEGSAGGVVSDSDCCSIISASFDRNNVDLALSVFSAMRSSFDPVDGEKASFVQRWKWSRPDVHTYTLLVHGLAASPRVSDALKMIGAVSQVGVSPGEEIVSCSKCRYQYELVSGNIVSIASEEIRIPYCRAQHGCSCMEKGAKIPANKEAKHSCCSSFYCGADPIWDGTHPQICY